MDSCILITKEEFLNSKENLLNASKEMQRNTKKIIISSAIVGISLYDNISCISIEQKSLEAKQKVESTSDKSGLVSDPDKLVRFFLAVNSNVSVETLQTLANDKDPMVLAGVLENPKTPVTIFYKLSENPNEEIKIEVVQNLRTPLELLIEIYKKNLKSVKVKEAFVTRKDFSKILIELANDSSEVSSHFLREK